MYDFKGKSTNISPKFRMGTYSDESMDTYSDKPMGNIRINQWVDIGINHQLDQKITRK
ncbi:MAG: hypothetical protein Ct9H300mP21_01950 [Pseudomonadota bacterium]|nr:MAG: hypothetical protein Ct9H300mP21_01950 [Pseudomonadota bacterium]